MKAPQVAESADSDLYLLDTNIVVHYVRGDAVKDRTEKTYQLLLCETVPIISAVTEGEIRSLALQWQWGADKIAQMNYLLDTFPIVPIERPEIMTAYALIDSYCVLAGRELGKNDAWIAATVRATGATLLTTDKDFDHLDDTFLNRIRIEVTP